MVFVMIIQYLILLLFLYSQHEMFGYFLENIAFLNDEERELFLGKKNQLNIVDILFFTSLSFSIGNQNPTVQLQNAPKLSHPRGA